MSKNEKEIIPGMRAQGKGIKCYVDSECAPLKACIVGNPESIRIPDPDFPELANSIKHSSTDEFKNYLRKHKGKHLKDVDPKTYDALVHESNSLAEAYRKAGVRVIRNEGKTPEEIVNYNYGWAGNKFLSLYAKTGFQVLGHCLVSTWGMTPTRATELAHREAINEIMQNDPEAVWLTMPVPYPSVGENVLGPLLDAGDFRIFPNKVVVLGIGVSEESHIHDRSKPRSHGTEYGNEVLRRMLKPFGWRVETVYFNSHISYHIDCVMSVLDEGLLAMPKYGLLSPLPKEFRDWEVIEVDLDECKSGACNNVPLGHKSLLVMAGAPKFARELGKRGWNLLEVPYRTIYETFGSGISCSTGSIWREKV